MTKSWANEKQAHYYKQITNQGQFVIAKMKEVFGDTTTITLNRMLDKFCEALSKSFNDKTSFFLDIFKTTLGLNLVLFERKAEVEDFHIDDLMKSIDELFYIKELEDSNQKKFKGSIVITDPCYLIREDQERDDWESCDYGENMEALGFKNYMSRGTLYGDWSCTTFDMHTKESIGEFCADAGLVGVFLLDEVLQYNPNWLEEFYNNHKFCATIIDDFDGTVHFSIDEVEDEDGERISSWAYDNYAVSVNGYGINSKTGRVISFKTSQTGL